MLTTLIFTTYLPAINVNTRHADWPAMLTGHMQTICRLIWQSVRKYYIR